MIRMKLIAELTTTIIAFPALCLMLPLNVLGGVVAIGGEFKRAPTVLLGAPCLTESLFVCCFISALAFSDFISIGLSVLAVTFGLLGAIGFSAFLYLFSVGCVLVASTRIPRIPGGGCIYSAGLTNPLSVGEAICLHSFVDRLAVLCTILSCTHLAPLQKAVSRLLVAVEVFGCGWPVFAALTAAFEGWIVGRGIIKLHQKFTFLLPSPGTFAASPGHFALGFTPVSITREGGLCQM